MEVLKLNNFRLHVLYWIYSYSSDVISGYLFYPTYRTYHLFLIVNTFLYIYFIYVIYFILRSVFIFNVLRSKFFLLFIPLHIFFCFYLATILNNYAHLVDSDIPSLKKYIPLIEYIPVYSEQFLDLLIILSILFTYELIKVNSDKLYLFIKEKNEKENIKIFQKLNNSILINSLHECVEYSKKSPINIQDLVEKFYFLIRYYISYAGVNTMTTVNTEIDNVNSYFVLLNERFSNKYRYELKVEGTVEKIKIPYMTLMLFVENACKYGKYNREPLLIKIDLTDKLNFKVNFQNEIDYNTKKGEGLGIKNFLKRLNILYKDKFYYKSYTLDGLYITELILPKIV